MVDGDIEYRAGVGGVLRVHQPQHVDGHAGPRPVVGQPVVQQLEAARQRQVEALHGAVTKRRRTPPNGVGVVNRQQGALEDGIGGDGARGGGASEDDECRQPERTRLNLLLLRVGELSRDVGG